MCEQLGLILYPSISTVSAPPSPLHSTYDLDWSPPAFMDGSCATCAQCDQQMHCECTLTYIRNTFANCIVCDKSLVICYQQILFTEAILHFWGHHSCHNFSSCRIQSRWWVVITVVIVGLINNVPGWRIIKMVVMGVDQDQLHANRGQVPQLLQSLYIWISFIKPSRDTWKESTKKAVPTWPNIAFLTSIITIFWSQTLQGCRVTNYK